jgi:hypothetical protein
MVSLLTGFIGGIIAWIAATFIGEPLAEFLRLRRKAADVLAEFEEAPWSRNPEAKPRTAYWLEDRRKAFDGAGTALIGFSLSHPAVVRFLALCRLPNERRLWPKIAGDTLRSLAQAYPGKQAADHLKAQIYRDLNLSDR